MTQELLTHNVKYALTGFTILVATGIIGAVYFGVEFQSMFQNNSTVYVNDDVNVDNTIDYISLPAGMAVDNKGQITATHTGQVTYTEEKYVVKPGDTLHIIAEQVYGDPEAWMPILKANNLASPDVIEVGMELIIPR